ncbi:MAG: hypothetical protein Q8N00_11345 [Nitrospirota bacterium]|nr:hypothetical protein [Nitrospirota bacterium]
MRMLLTVRESRLPMQDEEMASRMIRLFGRTPRPNRRLPVASIQIGELFGGLVLAGMAVVLGALLFTV